MEINDRLHASVAFRPGAEPSVLSELKFGWGQGRFRTLRSREKSSVPAGNQILVKSANLQIVTL